VDFRDREDAGRRLAEQLTRFRDEAPVILALPRGGVVLGAIVADRLDAPLDLVITRKIGHPQAPEYAIAAIGEHGGLIGNEAELAAVDNAWLAARIDDERREAARRRDVYLGGRAPYPVRGKTAILVDDGVATGLTLRAAIRDVRERRPHRIVVAVPVIPREVATVVQQEVEDLVALEVSAAYRGAVGMYYEEFAPVEDDEVVRLIHAHAQVRERAQASV